MFRIRPPAGPTCLDTLKSENPPPTKPPFANTSFQKKTDPEKNFLLASLFKRGKMTEGESFSILPMRSVCVCECNDEPWAAFVNGSSVAAALAAS